MSEEFKNQLLELFSSLPEGSVASIDIKNNDEIEQNNDYFVAWELFVTPKNIKACPIRICFSPERYYGFSLCSFMDFSNIVNTKTFVNPCILLGGHEPLEIAENEILERCYAVINGQVVVKYKQLFNRIMSAEVFLDGRSFYPIRGIGFGKKSCYHFPEWQNAI